jgi:nucleotide-binding universal stress UspA family protein
MSDTSSPKATVVAGVDGSEPSVDALCWAMAEAARRDARLDVVHAWHAPAVSVALASVPREDVERDFERGAEEIIDAAVAAAVARGGPQPADVRFRAVHGHPAEMLIAESRHADLVVIGSRGHGAVRRFLLGSVSQQVAQHSSCPVTVIPEDDPGDGSGATDGVMVGVDGSEGSKAALRWAADAAVRRNAPLTMINAWFVAYPIEPAGAALAVEDREALASAAQRVLEEARDELVATTDQLPDRIDLVTVEGAAGPALVARAEHAEVLVLGHRGTGGFVGMLLGSASQYALHHATCPTTVVP